MPPIKHAVIAAAGLGSRLGHGIPKCLVEIEGKPLIARQLELLASIADVRVVVGFMEDSVAEAARRVNDDILIVRNPEFRITTTQDSYALAAADLDCGCLFLDADIIFEPESFREFVSSADSEHLLMGVTAAKTDDAVFAVTRPSHEGGIEVTAFSKEPAEFEWANIVCAPAGTFMRGGGPVFQTLSSYLPVAAREIVSYEVDTEQDLRRAIAYLRRQ